MMLHFVVILNSLLSGLLNVIFWPLQGADPLWALFVISLITGLLILWVFAKVSNQAAIGLAKRRIRGNLLAVRLFQHDLKVVGTLQWALLKDTLGYLGCSFRPIVVLIVPLVLIIAQLNLRFAARPLEPGEEALVKTKVADVSMLSTNIVLEAPDGVRVETPGVRIESDSEIAWRVRPVEPGVYSLKIHTESGTVEKELRVGKESWATVSKYRAVTLAELLLYPGEPAISPSKGVESVEVTYPNLRFLGYELDWLIPFFVFSTVSAFAFSRVLRVEI